MESFAIQRDEVNSKALHEKDASPLRRTVRFILHLAVVYLLVQLSTPWLAGWTRSTLLPLLQHPSDASRFQFLFSHLFEFSVISGFMVGMTQAARFHHRVALLVWVVPFVIVTYKLIVFPSSILQSHFTAALHYYFGRDFLIPEFRNWADMFSLLSRNPDMPRGMQQLRYTAPLYAAIGYGFGSWVSFRTDLNRRIGQNLKRFGF
jgi:hypothetical protein